MKRIAAVLAVATLVAAAVARPLAAQETLEQAAQRARAAWLAHDVQALVGQSSSLILQIPGADPSSPLGRAQAMELLRRHFQIATEQDVAVTAIREVENGRGFVEWERRYVVRGTADVRRETVFLGFRLIGGKWSLAELRSTP